jgi:hypothetical protein
MKAHLLAQMGRTVRLSRHGSVHRFYPEGLSGRPSLTFSTSSAILVNHRVQNARVQLLTVRAKLARPEFFCWPGAWMAGERMSGVRADIKQPQ